MADSDDVEKEVEAFRKQLLAKKKGDGDEVWVRNGDGPAVRVTGERATNVLAKFGDLFDAPKPDGDGGDGDDGDDGEKPERNVFGRKLGK